jgi:hypothetical protein
MQEKMLKDVESIVHSICLSEAWAKCCSVSARIIAFGGHACARWRGGDSQSAFSIAPVGPQDYHVVTTELFYLPPHRGDGSELIVTTKL